MAEAHQRLIKIVKLIEANYGHDKITPNLHLSLHLCECTYDQCWYLDRTCPWTGQSGTVPDLGQEGVMSLDIWDIYILTSAPNRSVQFGKITNQTELDLT